MAYGERCQELFQLASKKAALETGGRHGTEEYERLTERLAEVREVVDATLDEVGVLAAFDDLPGGTDGEPDGVGGESTDGAVGRDPRS